MQFYTAAAAIISAMLKSRLAMIVAVTLGALCLSAAPARAPFTLEQIYTPPYPFGLTPRMLALSDDGAWLACGYNAAGYPCRDLWVYSVASRAWFQRTDLWPDKEARLRRDFACELRKARAEWEKAHPPEKQESGQQAAGSGQEEKKEKQEFDEAKRIEDFEKEVRKQRLSFGGVGQILFRRASHEVLYVVDGAVFSLELDAAAAEPFERLRHEQGFGNLSRIDDCDALLLESDADLLEWWPDAEGGATAGRLRQLTSGGYGDLTHTEGYAISAAREGGRAGRWLAYATRDYTAARKTQIPDLLPADPSVTPSYHVRPGDTPERCSLTLLDLDAQPPWPVEVKLADEPYYYVAAIAWTPASAGGGTGSDRLLLGVVSGDTREYKVYVITPPAIDEADPAVELLYREHDDKWLNWDRTSVVWSADGRVLLQSERDGMSALYELVEKQAAAADASADAYAAGATHGSPSSDGGGGVTPPSSTTPAAGGETPPLPDQTGETSLAPTEETQAPAEDFGTREPKTLLRLAHEVLGFTPLRHSPRALVKLQAPDATAAGWGVLSLENGSFAMLTPGEGWRGDELACSEDESRIAYLAGDERHMLSLAMAELPADQPRSSAQNVPQVAADASSSPMPLFDPLPVTTEKIILDRTQPQWQAWADSWDQQFIDVPGDGGPIPVKLHLPPKWRAGASYPLLLWAHGGGYYQADWRQPGFLELFHPWLAAEKGWIVAEVDYRGSSGYGRDWRVDVWGDLGHHEVDDLVAVKHYLMDKYGADAKRTALWGWSYGGYLTLMALGLKPGEFPVGCAVAPVTRWENYFAYFSQCRLGLPADNPREYEQSSAETYLKDVKDHLLIIHGLRDDNTVFQSVAQYLEKSHELGVDVELDLFPSDSHGIGNEQHYIRVFQAVVEYCEANWAR